MTTSSDPRARAGPGSDGSSALARLTLNWIDSRFPPELPPHTAPPNSIYCSQTARMHRVCGSLTLAAPFF